MTHPELETLLTYVNQQLDDDMHRSIEHHVASCRECQILLVQVQTLMQRLDEDAQISPRPELMRRAVAAFRHFQRRALRRSESDATLLFDSWGGVLPEGARGPTPERQQLYHFADVDIDVQIMPAVDGDFYHIQGQILRAQMSPDVLEGIALTLLQNQGLQVSRRTLVDHLGRFHFSLVPLGDYLLQVELQDAKVHVGALSLTTA